MCDNLASVHYVYCTAYKLSGRILKKNVLGFLTHVDIKKTIKFVAGNFLYVGQSYPHSPIY